MRLIDLNAFNIAVDKTVTKVFGKNPDPLYVDTLCVNLSEFLSYYLCSAKKISSLIDGLAYEKAVQIIFNCGGLVSLDYTAKKTAEETLNFFLAHYLSEHTKDKWRIK